MASVLRASITACPHHRREDHGVCARGSTTACPALHSMHILATQPPLPAFPGLLAIVTIPSQYFFINIVSTFISYCVFQELLLMYMLKYLGLIFPKSMSLSGLL